MVKLYYAQLKQEEDISEYPFNNMQELIAYVNYELQRRYLKQNDRVYLLSFEDEKQGKDIVFIDENPDFVIDMLMNYTFSFTVLNANKVHLHEYESYEAAYEVALMMREVSPLCYDNKDEPFTNVHIKGL